MRVYPDRFFLVDKLRDEALQESSWVAFPCRLEISIKFPIVT